LDARENSKGGYTVVKEKESIAVIGAGSWGTALALVIADNQHEVRLWGHNQNKSIKSIKIIRMKNTCLGLNCLWGLKVILPLRKHWPGLK
jgi:hypothetical protein